VDLTAIPTVQRKRRENEASDVVSDLLCLLQSSLIVRFCLTRLVPVVSKLVYRFMRNPTPAFWALMRIAGNLSGAVAKEIQKHYAIYRALFQQYKDEWRQHPLSRTECRGSLQAVSEVDCGRHEN
jgi:hypothetical protein